MIAMNYEWRMNTMLGPATSNRTLDRRKQEAENDNSMIVSRWRRITRFLMCVDCCKGQKQNSRRRASRSRRRRSRGSRTSSRVRDRIPSDPNSEVSIVQAQVSEFGTSNKKSKKKRKKREKSGRSSRDSSSKRSTRIEDIGSEKDLKILETSTADVDYQDAKEKLNLVRHHHSQKDLTDIRKACCFLCVENSKRIAAAASSKVGKSDQSIQVAHHEFLKQRSLKETSDKSCNPRLNVRTVQSSVKVKTRDKSTICPEAKKRDKTKHKSKYQKFGIFPKFKLKKCPATQSIACETDCIEKLDDKRKHVHKDVECCRDWKN